ncbi:Poly(A) RNA polymerase cid13 [Exophiala dermatitidis]
MTCRTPKDGGKSVPTPMTMSYTAAAASEMEAKSPTTAQSSGVKGTAQQPSLSKSIPSPSSPDSQKPPSVEKSASPVTEAAKTGSPLSDPTDKSRTSSVGRKQYGGCKYETGMARARRRVPYSLGPDPLEKVKSNLKTRLTHEEDEKLTADMQKLYETLQPTAESEQRRSQFINKLDKILRERWPASAINVNVFGSTGNNLGTSDSDVDVCITTDCKEMEHVCSIADLLAKHGMERVVCVSSAKVPIVKIWDPELQVACDINVNNPLALENTELVRTYVSIDSRVRPLAMIIKYWAKRRILNDAALGGTLSSYTWICLALNFLQTRDPPILPTLQQQPHLEPKFLAGVNVSFDRDVDAYRDFGARNKSSLGELLFHFFRYYGHELDFEQSVVSVRLGRVTTKVEKSWHLLQDNRLCVEEPFNISRNLANTADDTSMRGIHMELRRAYDLIGEGKLEECCEQFVYPAEEIKPSEHFVPPSARPVIPQPPPQAPVQTSRAGRTGARGGKHANNTNRNSSGRRSSNPTGRNPGYLRNLPFQMTTQELQLQAQHQQHLLHDQLFQQYQYLQLQEQELRMQLHQQNLRQRGLLASAYQQQQGYAHFASQDDSTEPGTNAQTNGISRAPLSAPLHQHRFPPFSPYLASSRTSQGVSTNPSSPRLNSVIPDTRRYSRRTSVTQSSPGASLRAQSQPARPIPVSSLGQMQSRFDVPGIQDASIGRRSSASSSSQEHTSSYHENGLGISGTPYDPMRRPGEYIGYYVGQSPSLSAYNQSTTISPIPSHVGLAIQNGGLSPQLALAARSSGINQTPPPRAVSAVISENQPVLDPDRKISEGGNTETLPPMPRSGPLIVDGSVNSPRRRRTTLMNGEPEGHVNYSASTSEDLAFDTPSSSDEQSLPDTLEFDSREKSPSSSPSTARKEGPLAPGIQEHAYGHIPLRPVVRGPTEELHINGTKSAPSVGLNGLGVVAGAGSRAWSLDRQLSSVEEVQSPSPRLEEFTAECQPPENGSRHSKLETTHGGGKGESMPLLSRANGSVEASAAMTDPSVAATSTNGWQTQRKKRKNKRPEKSENDPQALNISGGESLPADESLRKGG